MILRPGIRGVCRFYKGKTLTMASPVWINLKGNARSHSILYTSREFSIFSIGKFAGRMVKVPAAVGGGLAAVGSYVAYKVEEASSYTQGQLDKLKEGFGNAWSSVHDLFSTDSGGAPEPDGGDSGAGSLVGAAAVASFSSEEEDDEEDDDDDDEDDTTDNQMLSLTRQMIEIRSILQSLQNSSMLKLPSIVVVGSQSSGKSSVLEAIVGHEFLPKGNNMVTRRPIELTLVNSPELAAETAEFPALKMYNLTDFHQVQRTLFDLNMAVPTRDAISSDPIQLTIKSPNVPDLSLVDLPGYIQVEAADQPLELKQKIREVCDRYLEEPNIILAISAADVDLANSSALRAAKLADPRGERSIGVITKLDLVDAQTARQTLTNKKYPLRMGYVGVITKLPQQSLFRKQTGVEPFVAQQNNERSFLKQHKEEFTGVSVGTRLLKKKLMKVLEKSMATCLMPTYNSVQKELEETSYKFKVEFNDRSLTPETYLAGSLDELKVAVKELSEKFSRPELRSLLKSDLDQRVLDLLAQRYWKLDGSVDLKDLANASSQDVYWHRKLDTTTSSLTKSGVGRLSTNLITNALLCEVENLTDNTQLRSHPLMKASIRDAAVAVLKAKFFSTADQVENSIKPYKYEIELEDRDWSVSRKHIVGLLQEEERLCQRASGELKKLVGGKKLGQVISFIESDSKIDDLGFSPGLIVRGREAMFLRDRSALLKFRIQALKSSQCKRKENKYKCPEIFLDAVADKLATTAVLFLNVELLSDFYYNFPRQIDSELGLNAAASGMLSKDQVEMFAKEDPKIRRHIELQQKKELLELAMSKIEDVLTLQKRMAPPKESGWLQDVYKRI